MSRQALVCFTFCWSHHLNCIGSSIQDPRHRPQRIRLLNAILHHSSQFDIETSFTALQHHCPRNVFVDSLNTMETANVTRSSAITEKAHRNALKLAQ